MKRWILTPDLFSTSILACCYRDPIQKEVHFYLQDKLAEISHLEDEALAAFERVTREDYTTDQELYNTLIYDIIPVYYEFLTRLELIELTSPSLQRIHEDCIIGVNLQYKAFIRIATALEDLDNEKIKEANSMLVNACQLMACPYVYY